SVEGLAVVQVLAKQAQGPRLWWVTRGAMPAIGAAPSPSHASLWGLGRTVMQEHPELRCTLVDVDAACGGGEGAKGGLDGLGIDDDENQVAWRSGQRHVARMVRAPPALVPKGENYALETKVKGEFEQLRLVPTTRRAPGHGEVEISVRASGLNFRDGLNALGM